jgi:DNA repair photolyase
VRSREVNNPLSRFAKVAVEYDDGEGPPPASVTLLEDHSRSILSRNDSPDLGFRWSANPYRGCVNACAYCLSGDTPILLGDTRTRPIADLRVGDEIYGTRQNGRYRYYVRTVVLAQWQTRKAAFRIKLTDGTELVASGDHRFLSERGWKHVVDTVSPQRPHLTTNNFLIGTGRFADGPTHNERYRRGYLSGMIRGDGLLKRYQRGNPWTFYFHHVFRLALVDLEALHRARQYLAELEVESREYLFSAAHGNYKEMRAISANGAASFDRICELIRWPGDEDPDWFKGFLAGVFDAEGARSKHILRISNQNERIIEYIILGLQLFQFDHVVEQKPQGDRTLYNVRVRGGRREHLRFFHLTGPAITRKWNLEGGAIKAKERSLRVASIEPVGEMTLYDITTGTGDFIANGVVSHNCYARPTHEYLDLGAGTDFDTKIVVKPRAAELLRETFEKPSWKGELVMFSGVTDCYQAIESKLGLTRACLEVCLEYRNPVSIISKSALVERDVELLAELAREAGAHVNVSLAWIDAEDARAIEPWAASPQRRLKVIETLAKAGVPVGIMCAPIIPGLNDGQIPKLLEAARAAGAQWAGWTLLRLPGAVAEVFPERLRAAMPLSAERVLARIRETRGGTRMTDARFHSRGRGEGVYAETIAMLFQTTAERLGLAGRDDDDDERPNRFQRPPKRTAQLSLF